MSKDVLVKNSTSFPAKITTKLKELYDKYTKFNKESVTNAAENPEEILAAKGLKYYQYLIRGVMTDPSFGIGKPGNSRGLLIYHTMGMGKTFLAVASAIAVWDKYKPLVILAKSLQKNFSATIEKYIAMMNPNLEGDKLKKTQAAAVKRFKFISLDAYNMADQVDKASTNNLNDKFLIVDEAHNLFRGIINSSNDLTNARRLYNMIMGAKNLRLLFLTGTPASKSPFELVACFNMLAGEEILPSQYEVFYKNFVNDSVDDSVSEANKTIIKNRDKLANRLLGMVSYVSVDVVADRGTESDSSSDFPEEYPTKIENAEMSSTQYKQYLLAREREGNEKGTGQGQSDRIVRTNPMSLPSSSSKGSTYYVKSRTLSNFAQAYNDKIEFADLENYTCDNSAKMCKVVENLKKSPGISIVYSQFVSHGGLEALGKYMERDGYIPYVVSKNDITGSAETPSTESEKSYDALNANAVFSRNFMRKVVPDNIVPADSAPNYHMIRQIFTIANDYGYLVSFMRIGDAIDELTDHNNNAKQITDRFKKMAKVGLDGKLKSKPSSGDNILWLSTPGLDDSSSWYEYASKIIPDKVNLNNAQVLGFKIDSSKVLMVRTEEDIEKFEKEYVKCPDDISDEDRILCEYDGFVDWAKVSEKWSGISFNPYIKKIGKFRIWYNSLDTDTVMIWDNSIVNDVNILYTPPLGIIARIPIITRIPVNGKVASKKTKKKLAKTGGVDNDNMSPPRTYAIISGKVDTVDRGRIKDVLNSAGNKHGEIINTLLISKTGAEGLDLKGIRQVHILEPYWDKAREDQVKARGVRLGSHAHLPADERNVQPYLYISTANGPIFEGMKAKSERNSKDKLIESETIDERFHRKALIDYQVNLEFRKLLQEVSIECGLGGYKNCKVCMPTDQPLYTKHILKDLHIANPCTSVEEEEVDADELEYNGETYFYKKDKTSFTGFVFFKHNEQLDAYTPIDKSSTLFMELSENVVTGMTRTAINKLDKIPSDEALVEELLVKND